MALSGTSLPTHTERADAEIHTLVYASISALGPPSDEVGSVHGHFISHAVIVPPPRMISATHGQLLPWWLRMRKSGLLCADRPLTCIEGVGAGYALACDYS